MRQRLPTPVLTLLLLAALLATAVLALRCGSLEIPLPRIWAILWQALGGTPGQPPDSAESIAVLQLRLPRLVLGLLIGGALAQAGASLADVVRATYILPRAGDFSLTWPVLKKYFGEIRPACTMFSAGLSDPRMKIEIEVTARIGSGS